MDSALDNYFNQLANIKTLCEDNATTLATINTNLDTLNDYISDIDDLIPTEIIGNLTFQTINKFMDYKVSKTKNTDLVYYIYNLHKIKCLNYDTYVNTNGYEAYLLYSLETAQIKNLVINIINTTPSLKALKELFTVINI